jgi:hypothetical protein
MVVGAISGYRIRRMTELVRHTLNEWGASTGYVERRRGELENNGLALVSASVALSVLPA